MNTNTTPPTTTGAMTDDAACLIVARRITADLINRFLSGHDRDDFSEFAPHDWNTIGDHLVIILNAHHETVRYLHAYAQLTGADDGADS